MAVTDWPPFTIGSEAPFAGIDVDIALALERELGMKIQFRSCPFKRCLEEVRNGVIDLISGIAINDERQKYMDYIRYPYTQVSVAFYVLTGMSSLISDYEGLKDLQIGLVYGSHYFEPFNSDQSLNKFGVHRESQLLPMLAKGRIDTMIGTTPNLDYEIKQAGYKGRFEAAQYSPGVDVAIHFALSKRSRFLHYKPGIRAVLERLELSGELDQIVSHYR